MDQWGESLTKLGAIGASVYIFGKYVWPFLMQQIEKAQAGKDAALTMVKDLSAQFTQALKDQRDEHARRLDEHDKLHMEALRARDVLSVEAHRDQIKALNQVTAELKTLSNFIRNGIR